MMSVHDELARRRAARDALSSRAVAMLRADPRVVAAWLTGSIGQGTGDDLSDLDFWVIVRDDAMAAVAAERQAIVARIGAPVLIQEAPHNAPPGGAFLLVWYKSDAGLQEADWHWQPRSGAQLPQGVRLLFDRVGIPPAEPAPPLRETDRVARLTERTAFFWAMAPIAARKIARRQPRAALRLIEMMARAMEEVRWLCDLHDAPPPAEDRDPDPPPVQPAEQLAALRALTRTMESLSAAITTHGGTVPVALIPHVYDFYDFTERLLAARWRATHPPGSGSASNQSYAT
jgi:hypothetical protein